MPRWQTCHRESFEIPHISILDELGTGAWEAIAMASNAVSSIDTLLSAGVSLNTMSGNAQVASLMKAANSAFGVATPGRFTFSLSSADRTQLTTAQSNYKTLYASLSKGTSMTSSQNYLFCDSSTLIWTTKASDIFGPNTIPADSDETITDFFARSGAAGVNGLWKDPDHKNGDDYNWVVDEYNGGPICGDKAAEAITYATAPQNMFLCPNAWNSANYQTSLTGMRASTDEVEWATTRSLPGVFLHEMMHWLPLNPHVTDEKVQVDANTRVVAYGLVACWLLGGNNGATTKAQTLTNADSYNVFATMAYLPGATFVG